MTDPEIDPALLAYFTARQQQRDDAVTRALETLRPYERRLVREAAIMGYVRGALYGKHRDDIPKDSAIVYEVIDACVAMDDRYPFIAEAAEGRRRRVTKNR